MKANLLITPLCLVCVIGIRSQSVGQVVPSTTTASATRAAEPSNTRVAVRQVRIHGDVNGDLESIINEAMDQTRKQLKIDADREADYGVVRDGYRDMQFTIFIRDLQSPPIAKEFADQFLDILSNLAKEQFSSELQNVAHPVAVRFDEAARRLERLIDQRENYADQIRERTGRADFSTTGIPIAATKAEEERQRLELDVLGKTARRQAIEEEIARQTKETDEKVMNDPIAAELEKVVSARDEQVKRAQEISESGQASQAVLSDAVANAAEARAKLLVRRRDAAEEAGGELLDALTRELTMLSIDLRELNARLKFVKEQLPALSEAARTVDKVVQIEADIAQERVRLNEASKEKINVEGRLREAKPPRVEVLGADDKPTIP